MLYCQLAYINIRRGPSGEASNTHGHPFRTNCCPCLPAWLLLLVQLDWFEVFLRAQEDRGYEGSFNMFLQLQVGCGMHGTQQ